MPSTSKEAKQTRTASGEENPSLHAVSSSAVWRSRRPAGHTCLPAKKQNKQELQAAMRIQACMPSRRAVWRSPNSSSLLKAPLPSPRAPKPSARSRRKRPHIKTSSTSWREETFPVPSPSAPKPRARTCRKRPYTRTSFSLETQGPQKPSRGTRLSAYETTVLENTSLVQALRRLRLYSAF